VHIVLLIADHIMYWYVTMQVGAGGCIIPEA
jgi:hypothetical protein